VTWQGKLHPSTALRLQRFQLGLQLQRSIRYATNTFHVTPLSSGALDLTLCSWPRISTPTLPVFSARCNTCRSCSPWMCDVALEVVEFLVSSPTGYSLPVSLGSVLRSVSCLTRRPTFLHVCVHYFIPPLVPQRIL